MSITLKKRNIKLFLTSLLVFVIILTSLIVMSDAVFTANAWNVNLPTGQFTGSAILYKKGGVAGSEIVSKETGLPNSGDNLINKLEVKQTSTGYFKAVATFYPASNAINYRTSSDQKYRNYRIHGGIIMLIYNNNVYEYVNFQLNENSSTTVELNLQDMSNVNPNNGTYYTIEIAYKFRNNIISSIGNYAVWKSANINTFQSPQAFIKVDTLNSMNLIGSTTTRSNFVLINNEILAFSYYGTPTMAYVHTNNPDNVYYVPLFDGEISSTDYRKYKNLLLKTGTNTFTFYDIYGTHYPTYTNTDFSITKN